MMAAATGRIPVGRIPVGRIPVGRIPVGRAYSRALTALAQRSVSRAAGDRQGLTESRPPESRVALPGAVSRAGRPLPPRLPEGGYDAPGAAERPNVAVAVRRRRTNGSNADAQLDTALRRKRASRGAPFCQWFWALLWVVMSLLLPAALRAQELFTDPGDASVAGEVDRVYVRGLRYLASRQTTQGTWPEPPYGHEPAVVGLAMVSFLAHGDDPNVGPFQQTIRRGYEFILSQQATGSGYIGRSMYNHGFATLALAEGYGALDDPRLGPALRKAVDLILSSQARNPFGAWRYGPDSTDADTTVSGAQMVALFAARNAGIAVPEEAIQKGLKYYYASQNADGGFCYTHGTASNGPRTAIGCLVLALGREKNTKAFQNGFAYLQKAPPESSYPQYFLYYAAQTFFHASPEAWSSWNRANIRTLAANQTGEGSWEGSFGPTFGTAASLLSLALNYRYLPIYER